MTGDTIHAAARDAFAEHLGAGAHEHYATTAEAHAAYLKDPRVVAWRNEIAHRKTQWKERTRRDRSAGSGFPPFGTAFNGQPSLDTIGDEGDDRTPI